MTTTPTPTPLDRRGMRDRANAATPGPWTADGATVNTPDGRTLAYEVLLGDGDTRDEHPQARADAAFIAAARTDVPALLDELRVLHRVIANLQARVVDQLELIDDLADQDPCQFDHHGYCQAHGWFDTEPACPHGRAAKLISEARAQKEGQS